MKLESSVNQNNVDKEIIMEKEGFADYGEQMANEVNNNYNIISGGIMAGERSGNRLNSVHSGYRNALWFPYLANTDVNFIRIKRKQFDPYLNFPARNMVMKGSVNFVNFRLSNNNLIYQVPAGMASEVAGWRNNREAVDVGLAERVAKKRKGMNSITTSTGKFLARTRDISFKRELVIQIEQNGESTTLLHVKIPAEVTTTEMLASFVARQINKNSNHIKVGIYTGFPYYEINPLNHSFANRIYINESTQFGSSVDIYLVP